MGKNRDIRVFYYSWLNDRQVHGLHNAIKQLTGINLTSTLYDDNPKILLTYNSIDTHLSKNFAYWDLIKFIYGYGVANFGGDNMKFENLYLPIAMKSFGIPHSNCGIYYEHYANIPARYCIVIEDIIFGLPNSILQPLRKGQYNETLILPGNGLSCIGSPLYGIKKDLAYGKQNPIEPNLKYIEIYLPIRGNRIYFFKDGIKG